MDLQIPDFLSPLNLMIGLFIATQILYSVTFLIDGYLFSRPVNRVRMSLLDDAQDHHYPQILLFYPVLRELEGTMRTTFRALQNVAYPRDKLRIVAIPNADDGPTVVSLRRLQQEFPILEIMEVPPTTDPSWDVVWEEWEKNDKVYWWHTGRRAGVRALPPKKTRQLIYAFYNEVRGRTDCADLLINYIDADSCPPHDHFLAAVAGMREFDVLQSQNVAGNLNASLAASWHAFDHMAWDGMKYPHLSADGAQPYWMLGKGLFFRASDLIALGGFHPWLTIEDPEVGMRFWKNGKKLGIIEDPLIEEVPLTFARGIQQRKRWACGFFQSLGQPLNDLGFTPWEKMKAWLNFLPCMSLWVNTIGFPAGVWALWQLTQGAQILPLWTVILATFNIVAFTFTLVMLYANTWKRTALVLDSPWERIGYMLRINPVFLGIWWLVWLIPLAIGFWMYVRDSGLVWERTEKINANKALIESHLRQEQAARRAAA